MAQWVRVRFAIDMRRVPAAGSAIHPRAAVDRHSAMPDKAAADHGGDPMHGSPMTYSQWMQQMRHNEQTGRGVVFAIDYHEHIVGQISLGAIDLGSMRTGVIGYWVDQRYAGHGFAPMAVALLADWAFCDPTGPRLHRMEIALLPENERSRRVACKVGCHYEGVRPRYMFVNGQWRDHETYSLFAEDAGDGFIHRLIARHAMPGSVQS